MGIENLGFAEIAALCRSVLSEEEVAELDRAAMAEAIASLSGTRREDVPENVADIPATPGGLIRRVKRLRRVIA